MKLMVHQNLILLLDLTPNFLSDMEELMLELSFQKVLEHGLLFGHLEQILMKLEIILATNLEMLVGLLVEKLI